jgi:type I restriction enzyme S subunit
MFRFLKRNLQYEASGSVQDNINLQTLERLQFPLPPMKEQRAIAHILGTLDDKIELNRRMNETLEAIVRAIFKSWFVDFTPVRAKASGESADFICQRLSLTPDLLALFPDSLQETDIGEIPMGWATVLLGRLCSRVSMGPFGSDIKTDNFVEVGVPVIRGGNLTDGFVDEGFVFVSKEKADQLRNANATSEDIVITHRGTLGQVGFIPKASRYQRYIVSQSQMVLSINTNLSSPRYVFEFLRSPIGQHQLLANASQVGVPAIARPTTSVKAIPIVAPGVEILRAFEKVVAPMIERVVANTSESRTLATLRDTLLPKLISGEIRAPELRR